MRPATSTLLGSQLQPRVFDARVSDVLGTAEHRPDGRLVQALGRAHRHIRIWTDGAYCAEQWACLTKGVDDSTTYCAIAVVVGYFLIGGAG
jgi:hypothetical protein